MTPQSLPPSPSTTSATDRALDSLAHGQNSDPFAVLGPHVEIRDGRPSFIIRTIQPFASRVEVARAGGDLMPMRRLPGSGIIFEAVFRGVAAIFDYRLRITYAGRSRHARSTIRIATAGC